MIKTNSKQVRSTLQEQDCRSNYSEFDNTCIGTISEDTKEYFSQEIRRIILNRRLKKSIEEKTNPSSQIRS